VTVEAVLAAAFPDRTVRTIEAIETGNRRRTALARFADADPVVVQYAPDGGFDTEATLRAAIRERTAIPVPATLAVGRLDGAGYLVSEYRPGRDLHTVFADLPRDRQATITQTFGRYLAELHAAFTFDGCGEVRLDGAEPAPDGAASLTTTDTPCDEWFREYGERAIARLPEEFDSLRPRLRDCVQEAAGAEAGRPSLYPWDLRPGNALYDDELTAVVDWEGPLAAPAGLALAKTAYLVAAWYVDDPGPLRAALRRGYREVRPLPTVRAGHRVAAIADTAVDSRGAVTRPGYPEVDRAKAIQFHRQSLTEAAGL
jgi:aminoglycoside phosphotransferase (APT) family kinase protein